MSISPKLPSMAAYDIHAGDEGDKDAGVMWCMERLKRGVTVHIAVVHTTSTHLEHQSVYIQLVHQGPYINIAH